MRLIKVSLILLVSSSAKFRLQYETSHLKRALGIIDFGGGSVLVYSVK